VNNILMMSVTASLLIVAIIVIRKVGLNRLPKKAFLVLWLVALCRLLIPGAVPLPFGLNLEGVFAPSNSESCYADDSYVEYEERDSNLRGVGAFRDGIRTSVFRDARESLRLTVMPRFVPTATLKEVPTSTLITIVWITGVALMLGYFGKLYVKSHRELRFATKLPHGTVGWWETKYPIPIYRSDRLTTPLAIGIFRPRVILPKSMNLSDEGMLAHVLFHEREHIKRRDTIWKLLMVFAVSLHWFNPIVWVMFIVANRDLELACDETATNELSTFSDSVNNTKASYAYTLINMAKQQKRCKFAPLYSGFSVFSKNAIEERIVSIMKTKRNSSLRTFCGVALVAILTIGVLVVSGSGDAQNNVLPKILEDSNIVATEVSIERTDVDTVVDYDSLKKIPLLISVLFSEDTFIMVYGYEIFTGTFCPNSGGIVWRYGELPEGLFTIFDEIGV